MNPLEKPFFFLIAFITIAIIILIIRKKRTANWGFKDAIKDPHYWDAAEERMEATDLAIAEAKGWGDEKVAAATREYVLNARKSNDSHQDGRALAELGSRTHSTVLRLLADKALFRRFIKFEGTGWNKESPLTRACDLLGNEPPSESVALLLPFFNHPQKDVRKAAIYEMAKAGTLETLEPIRKALQDEDESVRSFSLIGLEFATTRSNLNDELAGSLFEDIRTLFVEGEIEDNAAKLLFGLNPAEAKEFFLSPENFNPDQDELKEILGTLADNKEPVPRKKLLDLISELESGSLDFPKEYALGNALRLLGQLQIPEDRAFLENRTTHTEDKVATGAANGILCSHGLEEFEDTLSKKTYENLTVAQRRYDAVFMCDAEINNGGIAQFFVNSTGDHWKDALDGLEAIGSPQRKSVVERAIKLFEPEEPSPDRSIRQNQMAKLYRKNDNIFDDLNKEYFACKENVTPLLLSYVLKNAEEFR